MFNYHKVLAFIKRDYLTISSYRFAFYMNLFGIFFSIIMFYFLSKLLGKTIVPFLKGYGGDYFSFVLIGIAFSSYLRVGLQSFSNSVRNEQMMGTLEAIIITPTSIPTIIISSSLWSFIFTSIRVITYLLIGSVLFKVDLSKANIFGALIILILTIIAFSSLGILSAGFIMVLKQGDPLTFLFDSASSLLGGVYFPVTILPGWAQKISFILPITYSLNAFRHAILQGYSIKELSGDIFALLIFCAIMLPISIFIFSYAVNKAKRDGSLTHY